MPTLEQLESSQRKYEEKQRQLKKAYKEVFALPSGKLVLANLKEEFYDQALEAGPGLEFCAGQRDVVQRILFLLGELK